MESHMPHDIINADVLDALADMPDASFDSCFCDPPYGIGFMGKQWDHGVPSKDVWAEVLRVLKPGAFLLAFGGTRTYHRLVCAIEDAGFEIRDCIQWIYGSGFPKSHNIGKAIDKAAGAEREVIATVRAKGGGTAHINPTHADTHDYRPNGYQKGENVLDITAPATPLAQRWEGYGTALKPAYEPICVAMKPLDGTFANNATVHGVAGLNIDGGRVGIATQDDIHAKNPHTSGGIVDGQVYGTGTATEYAVPAGRWPANIIHDGSEEATAGFPVTKTKGHTPKARGSGGISCDGHGGQDAVQEQWHDTGSAARYFYCAKASKKERREGNIHPTVKPLSLLKYLATLILPPPRDTERRLLVPYSGSGSELIGGLQAGWDHVTGIELEEKYCEIAAERLRQEVLF